jgi:hypothetical protein
LVSIELLNIESSNYNYFNCSKLCYTFLKRRIWLLCRFIKKIPHFINRKKNYYLPNSTQPPIQSFHPLTFPTLSFC